MCSFLGMKWWGREGAVEIRTEQAKPDVKATVVKQRDKAVVTRSANKAEPKELASVE